LAKRKGFFLEGESVPPWRISEKDRCSSDTHACSYRSRGIGILWEEKIRWAIIESGGFSEYSEEGAALEKEVLRIARKWGIRIVGPNGIGINNFENGFVVAFPPLNRKAVRKGKVSLLVQSGGVSLTYLNLLSSASVGSLKL